MLVPSTPDDATIESAGQFQVIQCTSIESTALSAVSSTTSASITEAGLAFSVTTSLSLPSLQRKHSSCSDSGELRNSSNPRPFSVSSLTSSPTSASSSTVFPNRLNFDDIFRENSGHLSRSSAFQNPVTATSNNNKRLSGTKRKYSSIELGAGSPQLPTFIAHTFLSAETTGVLLRPVANNNNFNSNSNSSSSNSSSVALDNSSFVTPTQPLNKQLSRPNSPSTRASGTAAVAPRSRIASIRRESDCSTENEAAHEKLVKSAQQVSLGFEDFCLDDKLFEERKRAKSLTEPISIFTNAFLPQSSSPSPTRGAIDATQKQCYSPSTQQVVRSNIPYSPSPSPTPGSPYHRMRSMSPIAVRQISKRRYTGSNNANNNNNSNGSGMESDGEVYPTPSLPSVPPSKRQCGGAMGRGAASPLVRDPLNVSASLAIAQHFSFGSNGNSFTEQSSSASSIVDVPVSLSPCVPGQGGSSSSSSGSSSILDAVQGQKPPRLLVDPSLNNPSFNTSLDEDMLMVDDPDGPGPGGPSSSYQSFCSSSVNDSASTTFSSRANTPLEPLDNEADMPQTSANSFRCSFQRNANAVPSMEFLPLCRSFSATSNNSSTNSPRQYPHQSQSLTTNIDQILHDADDAPLVDDDGCAEKDNSTTNL